jgi:hypothetical protein
MPKNVYSEINLHITWHTKMSNPVLTGNVEQRLWIGRLKGGSSFYINHEIVNRKLLDWHEGYGVVSFGTRDLPWVIDYVKNQREHHAKGKTYDRLERITSDDDGRPLKRPLKQRRR